MKAEVTGTPVCPSRKELDVTKGLPKSGVEPVVKDEFHAISGLPEASVTPAKRLTAIAEDAGRGVCGTSVSVWLGES